MRRNSLTSSSLPLSVPASARPFPPGRPSPLPARAHFPSERKTQPGPVTDAPYAPQPILQGGVVVTLYPPGSPYLKMDRVREAEQYNMSQAVPGRISSIVNIHNPSIEVHTVDRGLNTGAAVILAAGGGHNTLNVGRESADFVPFFYNYGVNTVILRNRLRRDGYNPQTDAVNDALQAIRLVRAHAKEWNIDPNKIGIMGFSAGAELAAPAAVLFEDFDKKNSDPERSAGGNFFAARLRGHHLSRSHALRPQSHCAADSAQRSSRVHRLRRLGRQGHAVWADEYFAAMLAISVPNIEMHIYANGRHPGDGMTGGLTDRNGIPYGTWQYRFIDWFRDLGFLQKPGVETKAAKDIVAYMNAPPPRAGGGQGGGGKGAAPRRPPRPPKARRPVKLA